jgi:hypothetical protein
MMLFSNKLLMTDQVLDKFSNEEVQEMFKNGLLFILYNLDIEDEIAKIYLSREDIRQNLKELKKKLFLRITAFMLSNK